MGLQALAQAGGRVGIVNDKAAAELRASLLKWFTKHYVKGLTLAALKCMQGTDALPAFFTLLAECGEADVIAALRKLDPHRPGLLASSREAMVGHIRQLAAGAALPAPKPPRATKPKLGGKKSAKGASASGGVLERSRL